ncbi:MAG: hypothetical protein MK060_07690 [Blastomonas sp.]|uniref:hypothetical protein n=1 Tax=unclassified Blastomonas TaxID=2626550 RepID=UPI000ABA0467|nr:hypothetical protein [Blastomonas sp.]
MLKTFLVSSVSCCLLGLASPASAQVQGCIDQCYQTYNTRWLYCIQRYGGHGYDAELCMLNEYDVLVDCMNNCGTTYGANTRTDKRFPRFMARKPSCQAGAEVMVG